MTDDVWTAVPEGTEPAEPTEFDLGTVEPPEDTVRSVHERTVERAQAEARRYFVERRTLGTFAVGPDGDWPEPYRRAFQEELDRLEGDHERERLAAAEAAERRSWLGSPVGD